MGALYSKISRLHLDDKKVENSDGLKEIKQIDDPKEPKTPCTTVPKYLLDPRSATAEIKRTPLVVMREVSSESKADADTTPLAPPYLETDLDGSVCTIRTSTPVMSCSPMKEDLFQSSPVLRRNESFDQSNIILSLSQQEEIFDMNSDEEDGVEQLFNNERVLFETDDQGSFDEEAVLKGYPGLREVKQLEEEEEGDSDLDKQVYLLSEDSCEADNEVEQVLIDIVTTTPENSLEKEFSEIEDLVFSAVNPTAENSDVFKKFSSGTAELKLDNRLATTKTGRTPLGFVSSNPCSPMQQPQHNNLIINNKDADVSKPWRGLTEERVNRGLLDVENTPPTANLPPPDVIQSAPGKLLLANRGRTGKATWGRDSSLVI